MSIFHRTKAGCSGFFRPRSRRNSFSCKLQIPIPKSQVNLNFQIQKSNHSFLETIEEKISVNSRASPANSSRVPSVAFVEPASTSHKNNRLSFASFRQIFTRIKKSFLLKASSASIQLAATEPDARTNCRTSSPLLTVLGNCFTNAAPIRRIERCDPRDLAVSCRRPFWSWDLILYLGFGFWDLGF